MKPSRWCIGRTCGRMMNPGIIVHLFILSAVALFLLSSSTAAGPVSSHKTTPEDQKSVSITIYNNDLGLVKDLRKLTFPSGVTELTFEGVASRIDPTSVHIRSVDDPEGLAVLEQNFEYDLISPAKLMEKYLGKNVELIRTILDKDVQQDEVKKAKLIGLENGHVYEMDGKIAINPPGRVVLPALPEGLISKPSLVWLLENRKRTHTVEASYLTSGIQWKANYVNVLSNDDKKIDLSGWVTIDNRSGATYNDASLKLIAGDVHRVERERGGRRFEMEVSALKTAEAPFEEKAFFEYHIYTLQRKTTIRDNQTKQLRLMEATDISVEKKFVYAPLRSLYFSAWTGLESEAKVGVFLSLTNSKENNLGMPLPKGVVRIYKKDADDALQFIGEDQIDHTPEDETIRLKVGEAFDVVAERVQTDFRKTRNTYESAYKISIRNHKEEDIVVSVVEVVPGDWNVLETTHEYVKETAHRIRFDVPVPKKGSTDLSYRVAVKR